MNIEDRQNSLRAVGESEVFVRDWGVTASFLKKQLDALCKQSNNCPDAGVRAPLDERAQNIRRVLVDMGELDKSAL